MCSSACSFRRAQQNFLETQISSFGVSEQNSSAGRYFLYAASIASPSAPADAAHSFAITPPIFAKPD
jgi:hypothetical protein